MTQITDETYEATIRRPWFVPGAHERPEPNDFPADDYEAALASSEPIETAPGDLDYDQRSTEGGALFATLLCAALLGVIGFVWWKATHGGVL